MCLWKRALRGSVSYTGRCVLRLCDPPHLLFMHFKDVSVLFGLLILFRDIYPRETIRVIEHD